MTEATDPYGDVLSVVAAADLLGHSPRTTLNWIASKKIAATKLGPGTAGYVISRAEVDRVLRERQVSA